MKKMLLFLLTILATVVSAQENDGFRVQFSVVDATCYNNGKVLYALTDTTGAVLDSLPPQLSQVRVYYKLSETDSAHYAGWYYTGGTDTLTVNYGTYIVGVEALLADTSGGYTRVDTQTVLTISTSYQKPTAAVVSKQARFNRNIAGTLYDVPCADIGRIQLRILYGQFPYEVTVTNTSTGDTLRTVVFEDRQYDGTQESNYNYKDFYSIDSMPGGAWTFHVEDGCGYGLPDVVATVQTWSLPMPSFIQVVASSGNFSDSNVVKTSVPYFTAVTSVMDLMHQHVRYRFRYDGLADGEWHQLPYDPTVNAHVVLYDTVSAADNYCDILERNITFEYELSGCGSSNFTKTFQLMKPNEIYFDKDSIDVTDSTTLREDACVRNSFWHREGYGIHYYKSGTYSQYEPDNKTNNMDDEFYRYHYTHPLIWVYTDVRTGTVIKRDTVDIITDNSYLTRADVNAAYGIPGDSSLVIPVERKLLDGKGCDLYTTLDTMRFIYRISLDAVCWRVNYHNDESQCCVNPRWVRVYRSTQFGGPTDGTVVRLVRSPLNNLYNFEAVYHAADKSWTVSRDSLANTAAITGGSDGLQLVISDYCLPSGPYEFEVTTSCGINTAAANVSFSDYKEMQILEEAECVTQRDCGNLSIKYPRGAFRWMITNTSSETGLPADTTYESVIMKANVVKAPSAAIVGSLSVGNPQFTFSMPGTYVLKVGPNLSDDVCISDIFRYDTFYLDAATVEFEEALAVICDASSTEGDAWVRAGHGIPPYTYTLYDQADKQGNILATNHTGIFQNIPMHSDQTLSCLVQDSCNAYFHVNFQPTAMADLQKLWFDGGLTETTACEGTTLQIHALAIGDIWQYEWSGPDGFTSTSPNPYVFVPRGHGDGWYKVSIQQTNCVGEIRDSIYLSVLPAPKLTITPDTTVCPGEVMELRFTPSSDTATGDISFSVAFANASGVSVRQYTAASGVTVTDTFSTFTPAKIYPVGIQNDQCEYLLADPEDTIYIHLRTDIAQACQLLTTFDTVCYGEDARLAARATDSLPYMIRWYGDYAQTRLLKTDTIMESGQWSYYDTAGVRQRTLLYASIAKEGICPSVNGLTDSTMSMCDGETDLACGRHIRFYDSGGSDSSSSVGEHFVHRFRTSDSTRVSIHFDDLNLAGSAHLLIFSGETMSNDSLLINLTNSSLSSQTVISTGNLLTVCYLGNNTSKSDWSAVVEAAPGIAIADIRKNAFTLYSDEVCQSQTSGYDDPYGMVPSVVSAEELSQAMRKAGNYYYSKTVHAVDGYGCDTTVDFHLIVNPPVEEETSVVAARQSGYLWHDSLYTESGRYAALSTEADGCDRLEVLYLTIVDADCQGGEICRGDSITLSLSASVSETFLQDTLLSRRARPGDVLCTDGSILPVDSFLTSGKYPKGVVFHVDETGLHGLAVAMTETRKAFSLTTPQTILIQSLSTPAQAAFDNDGEANTYHLKVTDEAYSGADFTSDISAASYCYYYNPDILAADGVHHGWYLPSFAELTLMQSNVWDVKQTLDKLALSNTTFSSFKLYNYWSSTLGNQGYAWRYSFSSWWVEKVNNYAGVRPVTKF